jgi:hypothetical protein
LQQTNIPVIQYGDGSDPHLTSKGATKMARTRDGSVGQETYEAVTKLVEGGKTRTEAFAQVASDRKQQPGTVSANFYRVARAQGATSGRKRSAARAKPVARKPTPAAAPVRPRSTGSVGDQLASLIQQMVDEAVDARIKRLLR